MGQKGGKVIKVPSAIGVGMGCVYLEPSCKWSRDGSLSLLECGWYIAPSKPIKPTQTILEKRPNEGVLLPMVLDSGELQGSHGG